MRPPYKEVTRRKRRYYAVSYCTFINIKRVKLNEEDIHTQCLPDLPPERLLVSRATARGALSGTSQGAVCCTLSVWCVIQGCSGHGMHGSLESEKV